MERRTLRCWSRRIPRRRGRRASVLSFRARPGMPFVAIGSGGYAGSAFACGRISCHREWISSSWRARGLTRLPSTRCARNGPRWSDRFAGEPRRLWRESLLKRTVTVRKAMLVRGIIALIELYQATLSRLLVAVLGNVCRFEPSCSRYAVVSFQNRGVLRGGLLSLARLCKCHPFHPGGYDPPPDPPAIEGAAVAIANGRVRSRGGSACTRETG